MQNDHRLASSLGHPSQLLLANGPRAAEAGRRRPKYGARGDVLLAPMFRLIYYLYARRLVREIESRPMPRHVGIILDGNRRHGRSRGITEPREVYDLGANKLDEILEWCAELDIPTVTLWVFSTDNFQRPAAEVSGILASIEAKLTALACDPEIHRRRVRVRAIGCLTMLPGPVLAAIRAAERATSSYDGLELNIAVAYGGRQEITDAVRALLWCAAEKQATLAEAIDEVTPEAIASHLYTAGLPDPDLIIRTSGEVRLSGFLLWQSAHSEFYFTDVLWPAFRKIDFLRAIRSFQQRRRRYGC
jgi:short-chain Z-isoprenyl diphosphate synthase